MALKQLPIIWMYFNDRPRTPLFGGGFTQWYCQRVDYLFIAISSRSTQIQCNRSVWKLFVFDIVVYNRWILINNENHVWIKNNLIFVFLYSDASVEQESSQREFVHTKELSGDITTSSNWLQPNCRLYRVLKLPLDPHGHDSSPRQYLVFVGHGLHPCNAFPSLVTAYTHAFLCLEYHTHALLVFR